MNTGGEAADQIVKMSLNGVEVAAKITGAGAKQLAILLYTILKEQDKTKGAARLSSMLRSGKELKVFTVKQSELKLFAKEAKRYGVLYCALRGIKKNPDGLVDIMVRAEDASKINRIVERFELATVDKAAIRSEIIKERDEKAVSGIMEQQEETNLTPEENQQADTLLNDLMGTEEKGVSEAVKSTGQADKENDQTSTKQTKRKSSKQRNPQKQAQNELVQKDNPKKEGEAERLGESRGQRNVPLSETTSVKPKSYESPFTDKKERHSVRKELENIKQERKKAENQMLVKPEQERRGKGKEPVQHNQPQHRRKSKTKER